MGQEMVYEDMDDQQLLELIYRYDSQMSLADQEQLLSIDNREAVFRTLHNKLAEREQQHLILPCEGSVDDAYGDELFYEDQSEKQQLGLLHKNLQM